MKRIQTNEQINEVQSLITLNRWGNTTFKLKSLIPFFISHLLNNFIVHSMPHKQLAHDLLQVWLMVGNRVQNYTILPWIPRLHIYICLHLFTQIFLSSSVLLLLTGDWQTNPLHIVSYFNVSPADQNVFSLLAFVIPDSNKNSFSHIFPIHSKWLHTTATEWCSLTNRQNQSSVQTNLSITIPKLLLLI